MKHTFAYVVLFCVFLAFVEQTSAQGYDSPLILQGLNHLQLQSAAARGAGGTTIGVNNDASMMFTNPSGLSACTGIQISIGSGQQSTDAKQEQHYGGLQGFSAFSLLMEGTTGSLSDPDTSKTYNGTKVKITDQTDSVQRPFDAIGPNWSRSKTNILPLQAFVAVPVTIGNIRFVVGAGMAEYANLNWYYQNNNCLSPSVLSVLNGTISTSTLNANPYRTQWYQYYQQRDGSINGYGGSIAATVFGKLALGASAMMLSGSTTDDEVRVGRGRMEFYNSSLRLIKQGSVSYTKTGTSDYSGEEYTASAEYTARNFSIGVSVKPPTTITRKYSSTMVWDSLAATSRLDGRVDSVHITRTSTVAGKDNMELPWRGTLGVALNIRNNVTLHLDYEVRSFASAKYSGADGTVTQPWVSSSIFHVGAEYRPYTWLALRAGSTSYVETFEPLSSALRGDGVSYPIYSAGCGISFAHATLNIAYEYSDRKFVDTWSNAASINNLVTNTIVADLSYEIPW
ncbi:MAG: hypothetical protein NTV54_14690 [Ignavibacteriales bacterium]|nr:hypothetical protein [Ignavibacteriales bacterium]